MKKRIVSIFLVGLVILFLIALLVNFVIFPRKYENYVVGSCEKYDLETALVYATIKQESDFERRAVSKSGALGLMQILPRTAKWIANELEIEYSDEIMFEPKYNIEFGCFYLRYLFDRFEDFNIVICAYNAGEGKVLDWIQDGKLKENKIDYAETRTYLRKVREYYNVYKNLKIGM